MRSTKPKTLAATAASAALAFVVAAAGAAVAQQAVPPRFVASHRDWTVYVVENERGKVCYVASEPTKQEGTYSKRGNPAVLVALLPGEPPTEQVSVQPGYAYKRNSGVEVAVGAQRYDLFTQGEHAWARTDADDKALIGSMRRGSTMVVKGTSVRDTSSTDTYSLNGFSGAYEAMQDACKG